MAFYSEGFKLGILGGGQLGRMFIQEAVNFDVEIHILDPNPDASCAKIAHHFTRGDFKDYQSVLDFGRKLDVLTIEIEDVNTDALKALEKMGVDVYPQASVIERIKDKGLQKSFYRLHSIPTAEFKLIDSETAITEADIPCIQKLRTGGYDGRGVKVLRKASDLQDKLKGPSVLEKIVSIEKELSVIVARNASGEVKSFPIVELEFHPEANLVEFLKSPADISAAHEAQAHALAEKCIRAFDMVGILAVEMFLSTSGELMVNEVAPRTHNSGHQSIEGNVCSQFEQHLRSILNLPLGETRLREPSVMINLLGEVGYTGPVYYEGLEEVLKLPGVHPHIYGKKETKAFRKMGHITVTGKSMTEVLQKAKEVKDLVKVKAK